MPSPPFNSIRHAIAVLRRAGLVHRSRDGYVALLVARERSSFEQDAVEYLHANHFCRRDVFGDYPFGTIPYDA